MPHDAHHDHLHVSGHSLVHRLAPEAKLLGLLGFVLGVSLTPRGASFAIAAQLLVLLTVTGLASVPTRTLLTRLMVVLPFLGVAALLPFTAGGETTDVGRLAVSDEGLRAGLALAAKIVLGAGASIVFAATTPVTDVLRGLSRLRVPPPLTAIISFMVRYLDLVIAQTRRVRAAMTARAHDPRWLWQARPFASASGALFVRSYERGERTHQAMLAHGFTGQLPVDPDPADRRPSPWWVLVPVLVSLGAALIAVVA